MSGFSFRVGEGDESEGGLGGFTAAVEFFAHAAGAGLGFGFDGEDFVEDGDVGFEGDAHEGVGDGAEDFAGVEGLALPDDAEGDDGGVAFGAGEALDLEGDFVGAGDANDCELVTLENGLSGGEEGVGVLAIVVADDEGEAGGERTRGSHRANL